MLIDVGSSAEWVKICVEPIQSGLWAACLLAYRAAPINSGSPTTLPAVSIATSAALERALAWVYATTNSAPLSWARLLSVHWVFVTAFASHPPADAGSWLRQQEMFRTAIGSLVTTSRTAMPAQTQLWNAWHQCSAPLINTGPCVSSTVPMPFVPGAHSDEQNQGARLASKALASVAWSLHSARIRREHGAPARARRHGLKPMYIRHGGEPPLVHPQRRRHARVRAGRRSSRLGLQRTGHCVESSCFVIRSRLCHRPAPPP
jgi:hypothetical protein